jgi:SAM-dependent methyltransferase
VVRTDDVGITLLAASDEPWSTVPPYVVQTARRATTADQVIADLIDGQPPWSVDLQRRLLHPKSGAVATLVGPRPGATALVLGTAWASLPAALASYRVDVVVADWIYARLRLNRLLHVARPIPCLHLGLLDALPWSDESFDYVFLDVREFDHLCQPDCEAVRVKAQALTEVRRVLRRDGTALIGSRNALRAGFKVPRLRRREQRRQQLRHVSEALRTPWRDRSLSDAGLRVRREVVPYPRDEDWRWLVPGERLRDQVPSVSGWKGRAVTLVLRAGLAKWAGRDHYLLVQRADAAERTVRTLAESLVGVREPTPLTLALSDARVAVTNSKSFLKVPLSLDQQVALEAEVEKTKLARTTAFAPFVVSRARIERWHGVPHAIYPTVAGRPVGASHAQAAVDAALRALDSSALATLDSTTFWRRLSSARGGADAAEISAAGLREEVLDVVGGRLVPVGPTHGDLHQGNVLVPVSGHPLLVDWNRFELRNPLLLDALYAAVRAEQAEGRATLGQALLAFVRGEIMSPPAARAQELLGELTRLQAAQVVLLERIVSYSLPRRRHKPWTLAPLQEAVRALRTVGTGTKRIDGSSL